MPMQSPQDLFMHELEDMYDAEKRILKALPKLTGEARNPEFRQGLERHQQETESQIRNLEKVFEIFGHQPETTTCFGAEGLIKEHDHFVEEGPSPEVLEMFDLAAAAKTEHYEICAYTDLMQMATQLGHKDAAELLQQNLKQEENMAGTVEQLTKTMSRELQPV